MIKDWTKFAVSRLPEPKTKGSTFKSTVKAQAYQKEKNKIALMQRNFEKGLKGFRRSSVAI